MKDVVSAGAVLYDPAVVTQPACTVVVLLENRVVEDIHVTGHPVLTVGVAHFDKWSVGHIPAAARRAVGSPRNVPPDIEWPDRDRSVGNGDKHVLDIIVPYSHILIAALSLDSVVPAVGNIIAIDIAVGAREATVTAVFSGTHGIVKVMVLVRPALIVSDHVVSFRLPECHRLRPSGVGGSSMFLRPTIGIP